MTKKTKIICVTGGKGGTGKTLCAVNIAVMFKNEGKKVLLIDGDSENPNTYLLLGCSLEKKEPVSFFKPKIIVEKCARCGLCAENCTAHALLHVKDGYPIPILAVCSGCKLCYKICPNDAIEDDFKTIGWIYSTIARDIDLLVGELKPGEARSAAIIENLLEKIEDILKNEPEKYDVIILDTAPGAHCDVEELISNSDFVIPITEPTKFGKLDLIRIIELIELLNKEYKVIVNRSSLLGFREQFLQELNESGIKILGDIPLDDDIVKTYCNGIPIMEETKYLGKSKGYEAFQEIFNKLNTWIKE